MKIRRNTDLLLHLTGAIAEIRCIYLMPYIRLQTLAVADPEYALGTHRLVTAVKLSRDIPHAEISGFNTPIGVFILAHGGLKHLLGHGPGRKYFWLDEDGPAIWEAATGNRGMRPSRARDGNVVGNLTFLLRRNPVLSQPANLLALEAMIGRQWTNPSLVDS